MFSNIVVGVNGREGGHDATALAALLAARDARLAFVSVHTSDLGPEGEVASGSASGWTGAADQLVRNERELWAGPAEARLIAAPSVGEGLERLAAHREADLIVIGACERGSLGRVVVGDDAASVLHQSQRTVAVAPREYSLSSHSIRRIGVAYDGSPESQAAYEIAQRLADGVGASLVARCVVTPHVFATGLGAGAAYMEDPEDLIARTRAGLGAMSDRVEVVVGPTGQELAVFSQRVDLLVCGSRHNDLLRRVTLGSTSGYLARHSAAPLIITPAGVPTPEDAPESPAATAAA